MKPLLLPFLVLCLHARVGAADFATWTHRQKITIAQSGLIRIELEPALLDVSRSTGGSAFHDLRVISPDGVETPRIIELPRLTRPTLHAAATFKTTLNPTSTVLEFQPPAGVVISAVQLQTNAASFIKSATLETSYDGSLWQTHATNEMLCRQSGTERLRLSCPPAAWTHFRITIDDTRTMPVIFTGAQLRADLPELQTLPQPVTVRARSESGGDTHLKLDLGTANIFLSHLRLHTPEAVFQREATLLGAHATLYRLQHEGRSVEELDIPVDQLAGTREVELVIRNGDSPPLRIDRIEATRHPVAVVFQADAAGEWLLYMGNAQAPEPRYDIARLDDKLRYVAAHSATASAVEANSAYSKSATAPDVGDSGPPIDVSPWSFRRPVLFKEPGVIIVEVDPETLARSANDLHDIRVVREGRQLPFLAIKPGLERSLDVPIAEVAVPGAPTWSKWDIQLPFANFPASELLLESPTPLFARTLTVTEQHESERGSFERILSNANWQRRPGQAATSFHLALYSAPRAASIRVATDNGDNPRLQITSAKVIYPVVKLLFRVPDTAPVQLCYGNRQAPYTRYDLQLARPEFETATKVAAELGAEEKLPGFSADSARSASLGSPWLWAALALVVVALLWVVARMLPKQAA
ncbi:hypothetical protein [Prosthecobacter vanneervenii]|uniref:Transmembrane protein n=1 Tax=Prosthecobacter vanneervenii TaxID=48466 RepID=A0A7W8DJX0_9BACT|nr:hypothetical protein [Prosthecobacter vanneervenii]MBB5032507.1 hypothetical protein [Prosthecobacter vanneervenii]